MGVGVSRTEFGASSGDSIERLVPGFPHLLGDSDDFRGDLPSCQVALLPCFHRREERVSHRCGRLKVGAKYLILFSRKMGLISPPLESRLAWDGYWQWSPWRVT